MNQFTPYVTHLNHLFASASLNPRLHREEIECATNGEAKEQLCLNVPLLKRKQDGVFFTSSENAELAASFLKSTIQKGGTIIDPACGAGDLLLACAKHLPVKPSLRRTLRAWNCQLSGSDIHKQFVDATRARLGLKCLEQTGACVRLEIENDKLFSNISVASIFDQASVFASVDGVIMNPPFTMVEKPKDQCWGSGKMNASAVFALHALQNMKANAKLVAILPDVLRSGTSYEKWRKEVCKFGVVDKVLTLDQFDSSTDVHTFILAMTKTASPTKSSRFFSAQKSKITIEDGFDVSVGAVVDYRSPKFGPWVQYITAKGLPKWTKISGGFTKRRFKGTTVKAPFVVIRRTSRPEDRDRAVATIINGTDLYAVENHLIVVKPKAGGVAVCERLLRVLNQRSTTEYLNSAIRCRHLTVLAVKTIPIKETA